MKIGGVQVTAPPEEVMVIPRGDQFLVFRARALPDLEEFYKLCPVPDPPGKLTKEGWVPDPDDKGYRDILVNHNLQRLGYMVIHTLEPSKIEWERVDPNNPQTWPLWEKELRDAGMTQAEVNRVLQLVIDINSLSEERLRKARESFQRGQARAAVESSGPRIEQANTPSGEPAPVSE